LEAGLSWDDAKLPLIACSIAIALHGCLIWLNTMSQKGADYTALLKAVLAAAELSVDVMTTESLSHHPSLLTMYVLMVITLLGPMIIKVYILISFVNHQRETDGDFREWLAENNGCCTKSVFLLMILKLDTFVLLKCKVGGMRCFSAPLGVQAVAYFRTRGIIDLVLENAPQMVLIVLIAARARSSTGIASLLFFQFCVSGLDLAFQFFQFCFLPILFNLAHVGSKCCQRSLEIHDDTANYDELDTANGYEMMATDDSHADEADVATDDSHADEAYVATDDSHADDAY
jgi:hypothetical protein